MTYSSVFQSGLFYSKSIMITGGGSGIGRCTAHELASLGAHISIVGRAMKKLENVQTEILEDGGQCDIYSADIRDEDAVRNVVTEIVRKRKHIDGLFNNAGGQFVAPLASTSKNGFSAIVETNLIGGFLVAREVYNQTMSGSGGSIVNMAASVSNGLPDSAPTAAARDGMINLTMSAAVEWAESGVRVNAVSPGVIDSSGLDTYDSGSAAENQIQQVFKTIGEHIPVRRMGTDSEVSAAVCFLLSDAAAYITGANLRVDGGVGLGVPWRKPNEVKNAQVFTGLNCGKNRE